MKENLCPICEEGYLEAYEELDSVEYRGVTRELPLKYSECNACGSETATAKQSRDNKRAMVAFKKEVDGFLTGEEIIALREKWGITQQVAANIFGGGPVAFSKYEKNDVTQSDSMNKLLKVADRFPMVMIWLAKEAGEYAVAKFHFTERFPVSQYRPFVDRELKVFIRSKTNSPSFQYEKLGAFASTHEEIACVG